MLIFLIFDGGKDDIRGCYGSYQVRIGQILEQSTMDCQVSYLRFPECNTSNEAEYAALIRGLEWLLLDILPLDPQYCQLVIVGDSNLVLNQITGKWRVRARNLLPFRERAVELLSKFGAMVTRKLDRKDIERYLGH